MNPNKAFEVVEDGVGRWYYINDIWRVYQFGKTCTIYAEMKFYFQTRTLRQALEAISRCEKCKG